MAQTKFLRSYTLTIEFNDPKDPSKGAPIVITDPLTCEFDITRNLYTSASVCQLRIYNLSAAHRARIRYDFDIMAVNRVVTLNAGYGSKQSMLFTGNFSQAWSVREGTSFISQIECYDGGFAMAQSPIPPGVTFPAGTTSQQVFNYLIGLLGNVGVGFGAISQSFLIAPNGGPWIYARGLSLDGDAYNVLQKMTSNCFFIDNNKAYILAPTDVFSPSEVTISSASGLLGTPTREQSLVSFDMLLEPSLSIGQQINIQSTTYDNVTPGSSSVNGVQKIGSIKHRGVISGSECGDAITSVQFSLMNIVGETVKAGNGAL